MSSFFLAEKSSHQIEVTPETVAKDKGISNTGQPNIGCFPEIINDHNKKQIPQIDTRPKIRIKTFAKHSEEHLNTTQPDPVEEFSNNLNPPQPEVSNKGEGSSHVAQHNENLFLEAMNKLNENQVINTAASKSKAQEVTFFQLDKQFQRNDNDWEEISEEKRLLNRLKNLQARRKKLLSELKEVEDEEADIMNNLNALE